MITIITGSNSSSKIEILKKLLLGKKSAQFTFEGFMLYNAQRGTEVVYTDEISLSKRKNEITRLITAHNLIVSNPNEQPFYIPKPDIIIVATMNTPLLDIYNLKLLDSTINEIRA